MSSCWPWAAVSGSAGSGGAGWVDHSDACAPPIVPGPCGGGGVPWDAHLRGCCEETEDGM